MQEFKIADVARLTGMSRSTILKKIKTGEMKSTRKTVVWGNNTREEYRVPYESLMTYITLMGEKSPKDLVTLVTLVFEEVQVLKKQINEQNSILQELVKLCKFKTL